jgi:Bor protein
MRQETAKNDQMKYRHLKRYLLLVIVIISGYGQQSCSTTRVVSKYDCDTFENNPINKKTTWAFLWGLVQPKDINPKCDARSNHMNKVTVKNNLGFAILSVVTLGIVMPQRIEWCCAPYSPAPGTLGH